MCRGTFQPKQSFQVVCTFDCGIKYTKVLREKKEKKLLLGIYRKNKILKDKAKTLSTHKKELQFLVNKFVRMRDRGGNCVSCDRPLKAKFDAGHFYSMGGYPSVRFDLKNIWGQCVYCNRDLHGNLLPYRTRLINKIGMKEYEALEVRARASNKQTIPEIMELKELFKQKIKLS